MSWEVPITVGDEEYPVTFNTEQEPTEADIAAAVAKIQSSRQPVATAPEAQKAEPFVDFSDLFRASGQALATVPTAAPHAYRQLSEGLNNPWERSQGYLSSKAAMDARNAEMEKANQEAAASGDVSTLSRGMRQAAQSIGFSAGAMGSGFMGSTALGAGGRYAASALLGPEAAPVGETIGRVAGGLAAGYGAAYRMAGAQFLDDAREEIDRMFLEHTGRLPNKAEQDEAFSELKPLAEKFGHAEAGPEALGNMVMAGTGKFILGLGKETVKKLASNALAKVGAGAGALATELGGETVTQVEQKRLEDQKRGYLETGAMPAASEAPRTAEEYGEAFKEVAPATLATMGLLGAPAVAYKGIKTLATPATPRDQAIDLEFGGQALPPSPELGLTVQARVEQETQKMADNATKQAEAAQAPALAATIAEVTAVPTAVPTAEPQTTAVPTAEPLPVAEETLPPLGEEILPQPEAPVAAEFSPVTAPTETPSSTANAAGGSQSVQTEPAEGSIPAVTTGNVLPPAEVPSAETQVTPAQEVLGMEPAELRQPNLQPTTPDALQIERPAEISLRQTPTDSEGVLSVYPRVINGQDKWLVQQGEKRGFGDSIHDTEQEAVEESTREATRRAQRAQTLRDLDAQVEAEAKAKREKEDLGTFTDGMSPMKKGKVVKQLTAEVNYRGTLMTRRDLIQKMVKEGRKVETEEGQRVLSNEKGEYLGEKVLTKAGIDYALHLIAEQAETKSPAIPAPEPRKPRKFAVNPASDFIYEERAEAERQQRQANWMEKQTERITSRDILSADWEKINDDIQRGRRGLTAEKATALVDDAFAQGVIPKSWHENLTAKIAKTKEPANGAFYTVENGRVRTGPAFAGEAPVPSPKAALAEEKRTRGDELPVTDDKAPVTEGDSVVWQDENGVVQEGVLTKLNAGRNNLGEPVSTVALENSATVQVPRGELRPVMSSQRSRTAAGRKAAIQSLSGHLGEEVSVGASAEDSINAVTALQGSIPGVEKSWTGTRAEFLEDEALGKAFPDLRAALLAKDGDRVEGLFEHGRAFVITDQVIVFEGDVETAKREDITPEQAAVQRVITHESLVHRGFYALDKGTRAALFRWGAQNIYEAEMDQMAEDYGIKGDWVTDQRTREYLMEEIIARKVERLKAPPKSGPMKRLWDILERLWRRLSGQGEKPATLKDIQDVAKLLRTALELAENNVQTRDGMPIRVEVVKPSMAVERGALDAEYMAAVESGDVAKQQAMVDAAAKAAGFAEGPLLHGTKKHFTVFERPKNSKSQEMFSFGHHFTDSPELASQYGDKKVSAFLKYKSGLDAETIVDKNSRLGQWLKSINPKVRWFPDQGREVVYLRNALDELPPKKLEAELRKAGYDALRYKAKFQERGVGYMKDIAEGDTVIVFDPNQIKSADPITRDANGNVIPLSQRFNTETNDIRFSVRPTYTSPLDQTLANTAKAVRLMRDGPPAVPVNLQEVYRKAQVGKSSAMVSLDDMFAEAKKTHPDLTEAEFGEQLQALYNDNGAYLEPAGSAAALSASAEKYNVRNAQGIPATYVMVPDPMPVKASMRLPSATAQKLNGTIRSAQEASGDLTESLQTPIVGRKVHIFPGQAFEARLDAAKQVIDALQANGVSDADLVDAINDPKLHRELGIEQDADMLGLLFAEAMVRDIPKAFDAYEVVRERAGRALGSGALLHGHPRFAHLFLVNGALKQIRQQAEDATKAQANISGDEVSKLDKDSRNITSKETQESAEEEMFRLGEEALSKANQTLWQKLKNVVQRLGAATRIFAAKNAAQKPKASLQGVISDKEMAELEAMSPDELQAEIDKLQAEFSMLAKQMLGTTKKPRAAKGKADTGEGELTNAATARIIAQMAERMGAPVDTATAVAALTPEVGTLKAQFEKGIVSALVNKVKAAVTPKAPTGANLNSVMAQITKILADNLNLPENAPAKATLADRALDAFSRTRTNDQTIREVWEAARGKIRELLTQRATEAAGEKITAEEAAAIEAQVEEQLAAIASEVPERMWAKGQAYGVIRDALRELGYDTRAKVLAEPAVARQAVVDKVNSEVAKLPDVDAARWQANQSYLLASIDALIADMQASKARADARSRGEKRKSTFSAADSKTFAAIMENARQRSGDTVPLMPESSTWTKIFSSSPQSQEDKAASMLAYMKEDPALSQLTDEEQEKLAEMFSKTWEAKRKALLEAKVASVLKRREATEKGKQAVKDSIPKLIQAINRGELTDDVLNAEIAEKFGFEKLTEKEIATIERLSKELQQPDLPTHERVGKMDEMAKIVAAKTRMSKAEILSAWWTTAVLSGPKTAFTIGMAFQSGLFEVLSNAVATVARSYYQGKLTDGLNAAKQSITNYFKTFPKAMQLMWQYVVTKDKRLLSQADPAYTQYFDSGQNSPVSVGWKLRQDKRPLVREAGRFMYFVERLLTALDLFNSVTTQQGMLAMAYQLNEKTYDAARVASETDLANYRKKARDLYWGGVEPTEGKDKALLTRQSISLLEAELAKYANVLEDANYTAAQAAMTLTPEGAGGWLYQIIRGAATRQEIAAEKAVREAEQLTGVSPLAKATSKQLAYARRLAVHQMLNLTGLRFARFAGNKLNQSIGFLPLIGLLRLREQTYAGKMKQQAIWRNQSIGTTLAVLGGYMLKAIADEPDDEKRGWGIEGSHENLDRAKANELLTAGKPPYSLTLFGVTFNYANWPISSVLAALGAMSDRIKYDPKRWKEMSTGTRAGAAVWAGLSATLGVSALSQLSEIIGASPYSRDPLEAGLGKVSRVLGNFVGGAIPRLLKDLDAMAPGGAELRKYEGWERFGKEMPVYRRFIGAPMLDIFGKPVEKQPYPWSREYQTAPVEPEYKLLGQLASKGVFPTPADPDHRRVGKGKRSREMTDVEKKRFITNVGEGYRQLMLRHGERLTKMDTEAAKDLLGKLTAKARDRAEWQAVHPATETAP